MEQRSKEWFEVRRGRITASEVHNLMAIKGIGKTAESYLFGKAVERVAGIDPDWSFDSPDMRRGVQQETLAFDAFKEKKQLEFIDVKEAFFFPHKDYAGASPDGLTSDNGILEIKCPRPNKFFNLVANGIDAIDPEYYDQMQMQILCSNSTHAYFFNYLIFNGKQYTHEIKVPRDEKRIELIKERIEQGNAIICEMVEKIKAGLQV